MKRSQFAKRMLSECLVVALVLTMLPAAAPGAQAEAADGLTNGAAAESVQKDIREAAGDAASEDLERVAAPGADGDGGAASVTDGAERLAKKPEGQPDAAPVTEDQVRGVIDSIEELPQYGVEIDPEDPNAKEPVRGTPERPFVILEIVPYEEYAEFGYLIGGCEPVKIEDMYGRGVMSTINSLNDAKIEPHNAYFFPDEPEGKVENNDGAVLPQTNMTQTFNGYYEYVGAGNGTFSQIVNGEKVIREGEREAEATDQKEKLEALDGEDDGASRKKGGAADDEASKNDAAKDEAAKNDTDKNGAAKDNASDDAANDNAAGDEAAENAAAKNGAAKDDNASKNDAANGTPKGDDDAANDAKGSARDDASALDGAGESGDAASEGSSSQLPELISQGLSIKKNDRASRVFSANALDIMGTENPAAQGEGDNGAASNSEEGDAAISNESAATGGTAAASGDAADPLSNPSHQASGANAAESGEINPGGSEDAAGEIDKDPAASPAGEDEGDADKDADKNAAEDDSNELSPSAESIKPERELEREITGAMETEPNMAMAPDEVQYVREDGGDLIWHTVNDFEMEDYPGQAFDEAPRLLTEIGDRVYTTRSADPASDPVNLVYNHYYYKNYEYFLTQSMKLTEEEAANYSIVIKTITPDVLNEQPDWVDYSDLIVLSPKSHVGSMPDIWKQYNRLGKTSDVTNYKSNAVEENDLSWQVALSIYNKCTAKKNFAAIIIDDTFFNPGSVLTDKSRRNVNIDVMDWNLASSGMTQQATGYNNNFYKLCVMLMCMDDNIFKQLYLSGDDPVIKEDEKGQGNDTLQKDDAATFWAFETFLLVPPGPYKSSDYPYQYWKDPSLWENWEGALGEDATTKKHWTKDHVFTYPGDTSVSQNFGTNGLMTDMDKFDDFSSWLAGEDIDGKPHSSDAVHFILGVGEDDENEPEHKLRVLDLEPSVGLKEDSTPDWYLTESYVHMLLPSFTGEIEIVHQTTAEFIGKTEDLNSTYQMIFMGLDYDAYNTRQQNVSGIQGELPDWNDDSFDGRIYLHTGDKMEAASYVNKGDTRSVEWLYSPETGQQVKSDEIRFAGNDITLLKKKELENYRDGGYPIVAERYLYDLEKGLVDESSYIYQFIDETKQKREADLGNGVQFGTNLFSIMETKNIEEVVDAVSVSPVTFTQLPPNYSGETLDSASEVFKDQHYLPINSGRSYMEFGFDLAEDGYSYRIYVDQDRDSKFSEEEVIINNPAVVGHNYYNYRIAWSSYMVGMVQWRIEVYMNGNEQRRYVQQGSSAVKNTTGIRKKINVLQIMPSDGEYQGKLDLEESALFRKYYEDLADYEIKIKSITMDEYEKFFEGKDFSYDNSQPEAEDNPKNYEMLDKKLTDYNMLILGFGDSYGGRNLDNTNGAVDYIKYFIDQGHSVLFCHDLTSFYNLSLKGDQKLDKNSSFGSTANALLRDVMGMNRYKAVSIRPDEEERERIMRYEEMQGDESYDWLYGDARHGYTYWAMKRLGFTGGDQNNTQKMPFANMITNPHGDSVMNDSKNGKETGMNNASDLTTIASKLNDGQITEYPYDIEEPLRIAKTHGQYYQLDAEDEDVTVWYTLGPDESVDDTGDPSNGTSLTYEASPNDAMNNYYIYSKGNIFYSGVGHETVEQPMEAKLFVNTMIAAYNAAYEPPVVEIDNEEASLTAGQEYQIEIMQEYDKISDGDQLYSLGEGQDYGEETYPVLFSPIDFNVVTTQLTCSIRYLDENGDPLDYVTSVGLMENGERVKTLEATKLEPSKDHPEGELAFLEFENGKQYVLDYPKKYLNGWTDERGEHGPVRTIEFRIKNNRVKSYNTTVLHMSMQPLFPLD